MSFVITVPSEFDAEKTYTVRKAGDVWVCSCTDHVQRSKGEAYTCKHIAKVAKSLFDHVLVAQSSKRAKNVLEIAG